MYDIKDKVVLITGGTGGIGAEIVRKYLENGAKHIAFLDIDMVRGNKMEEELIAKYGQEKVKFYMCDVTTDDLSAAFNNLVSQFKYIDIVINAAGLLNDAAYVKCIQVNVTALITSSLKAYDLMRKDRGGKGGTIINVSSAAALIDLPILPVYSATKSAVMKFSHCIGMEPVFSRTGVRVITVCFGTTDTKMVALNGTETFDSEMHDILLMASSGPKQTIESAASGMVEVYKRGASASTWLIDADKSPVDITNDLTEANKIAGQSYLVPQEINAPNI